jgi:hypothetical protein
MRHFLCVPALFAIATLAQVSAPSNGKPEDPASVPCTVTGRVVTASEGNSLKSARVLLIPEHDRSEKQIYAASTDSDGNFTLKDIPPGRYQFSASHTGFVEQHYKAGTNDDGPLFSLASGEKVSEILFRLTAAAVITGRVSNEDGDPMQRVEVVALRQPNEEEADDIDEPHRHKIQMDPVASAQSDDRGQYRIFGLKPGEYFIRAEDTSSPLMGRVAVNDDFWLKRTLGSEYASTYFPGASQFSQAQVIPVKAGEEAQADVTMRRVKTVEIAGHVIGMNGPAVHAFIQLEPVDYESDFDRQDATDEKGAFRLRNIPEGSYYISALLKEQGTVMYETRARQKVDVANENIDSLTITVTPGINIQGKVKMDGSTAVPYDRIVLVLASVDEDRAPGGRSDVKKDGSLEFKSVHDGNYAIHAWGLEPGTYIKSMRHGPDDVLEKGVQVEGGSSEQIAVTIGSDGARLEGSVTDDDGPAVGARIRLAPDPLTPYNHLHIQRTTTDQRGHFALSDVAPGKYTVLTKPVAPSTAYKPDTQSLTLSENDHKTIEVKLEKPQE